MPIRYEEGKSTDIRMDGTPLAPRLKGKAKIKADNGNAAIEIEFDDLPPAINVAPGYATYVLWAITPDGRTENLGEFPWRDDPKMKASLPVQRFALIVTLSPIAQSRDPRRASSSENKLKDGEAVATTGAFVSGRRREVLWRLGTRDQLEDTGTGCGGAPVGPDRATRRSGHVREGRTRSGGQHALADGVGLSGQAERRRPMGQLRA